MSVCVFTTADHTTYPRAISTRKEPRDHQEHRERAFPNQSGRLLRAPRFQSEHTKRQLLVIVQRKATCLVDCLDSTRMPVSSQGGRLGSAQRILPFLRLGKQLVCQFENLLLV